MLTRHLIATALLWPLALGLSATEQPLQLTEQTSYSQGIFNRSAAEIIVYSADNRQFYLVNGANPSVDILQIKDSSLTKTRSLPLGAHEQPTSVAVHNDLVAVTVHEIKATGRPGKVIILNPSAKRLAEIPVGDLPDMVIFSKDGRYILTANEGEPREGTDPEGSVSVITLNKENLANSPVRTVSFDTLNTDELRRKGVRIAPGKTPAKDFEPEYITISGQTAYVSLQENNAIAVIDIASASLTGILPLGYKDHTLPGNGLDTSDKDGVASISNHPIRGFYMPDTLASFSQSGKTYLATANEGDAREEVIRLGKAKLDKTLKTKLKEANTGNRLKISTTDGDIDNDGDIDIAYSYGARSFSLWDETGTLVFDSGDQFAQTTLRQLGFNGFNTSNDKNRGDNRSDDKGSEPEAITIGTIDGRTYAFIGLERSGGIMIYDVTEPATSKFISYYNNRNFDPALDPSAGIDTLAAAGHLGPECVLFIPANQSPYGKPTLAVAYEVSGSVGLYTIE